LRIEGERAQRLADEGAERARNIQPTFMEQWGPWLGYALGFGMGGGGRFGMGRMLNREARETARRANTLSGQMAGGQADDIPSRVARVNQFWTEGGAPATPFSFQSARQPFPWATNPQATPPNQLFPPPRGALTNYGPGGLTFGVGAGEMGVGSWWLSDARQELAEAERALAQPNGTTPTNVRRVEDARAAVAQAESMLRLGMGTVSGGLVGEIENRITRGRLRPQTNEAQAEMGRLDQILNPYPAAPQPQPRIPKGRPGAGRWLARPKP
jgi:hypothetical protein